MNCVLAACNLQEMEEEANVKRARKAAEAAFLQLLKDNTPADAASTSTRECHDYQPPWTPVACIALAHPTRVQLACKHSMKTVLDRGLPCCAS